MPRLRRFKELHIDAETAAQLLEIAPATIDRRLKADRAKLEPRGRSHTQPGTLLKDLIPIRTWAEWDDAVPGAKISKTYDSPATPFQRVLADTGAVSRDSKARL